MAHSLSSQQYHNPNSNSSNSYQQCSPSASSHHATMYNNYHRSHRTDGQQQQMHGNYQQQSSSSSNNRLKLSSFKGKSWQSFGDALASESSDDETDNEDPLAIPTSSTPTRHSRASIVRLKRRDIPLYGYCPETDPFAVVTCRHCRKILKSTALKRHIDMRHDPMVKLEKISEKYGNVEKIEKIKDAVEKISVTPSNEKSLVPSEPITSSSSSSQKRHRHAQRKSTPSDNSNDGVSIQIEAPQTQQSLPPPPPVQNISQTVTIAPSESSSASNSPQPRRKKRKPMEPSANVPVVVTSTAAAPIANITETFQNITTSVATVAQPQPQPIVVTAAIPQQPQQQTIVSASVAPTTCRIIMSSSPPPLAPITTTNEAPPSVWIVTPSPAVIIDGSFVVKPLETDIDTEIDLKDLKVLKPAMKEPQAETSTQLTASNWYTTQPRPLALNTFNMRKISAQRYVMATQRKLIELNRTLRQDDKISNAVTKPQPKTWSFIERSQVFIPFRVTH